MWFHEIWIGLNVYRSQKKDGIKDTKKVDRWPNAVMNTATRPSTQRAPTDCSYGSSLCLIKTSAVCTPSWTEKTEVSVDWAMETPMDGTT